MDKLNFERKLLQYTNEIEGIIKEDDSEQFTKIYEERTEMILKNLEGLYSERFEEMIKEENEKIHSMLDEKKEMLAEQILESRKESYRRKSFEMYE